LSGIEIITLVLLGLTVLLLIAVIIVILTKKNKDTYKSDLKDNRVEIVDAVNNSFKLLGELLRSNNDQFSNEQSSKIDLLVNSLNNSFNQLSNTAGKNNSEIEQRLENIRASVEKSLTSSSQLTETKLENIRISVEKSVKGLEAENSKKLDEIRNTVDEKLQKTLEDRLSKSFQLVSERLEQVYKGLGEMQSLASGVGDLKRVLTNVKTRGILGEMQLANILEEIMTPDQYGTNVATKKGSNDRVEFAIKLPGEDHPVYLPIDAKFPIEDYQLLIDAYEEGDSKLVKSARDALSNKIKKFAKDISDKYIDVPNTTDFGIMFLPIEGLYAEVVKSGVVEIIQREYKINVSGPSTMAALLNSLQMGFKTLAIQKHSSEVWKILGAVKTEFNNFENVLNSVQKKILQANDDLDKLVGTRTRQIQNRLKNITGLPDLETKVLLPNTEELDD
jgi:DNA recombination protein RmuC